MFAGSRWGGVTLLAPRDPSIRWSCGAPVLRRPYRRTDSDVDELDAGAQPHCPDCRVVMRPVDGGDRCPECGRLEHHHLPVQRPDDFDGPSLPGW